MSANYVIFLPIRLLSIDGEAPYKDQWPKLLIWYWHNIGTVLLFRRKFTSAIISTVKNLQKSHSGMGWFFVVKVVIIIFYKKIRKALNGHISSCTLSSCVLGGKGAIFLT